MKNKNFFIPDGIEYYMPKEAACFEKLRHQILKIFTKYKYKYVMTPIFDNLDNLLSLKGNDLKNETIKINNSSNEGNIGIRADITPQLSRIDYQGANKSNRYCYMGDILKIDAEGFDRKNPYQVGAEYFGSINKNIDIEMIKILIDIITLSSCKKILIELGDLSFINIFFENLNLTTDNKSILLNLINLKSNHEIKEFFDRYNINKKNLPYLLEIINLSGDIKILQEFKQLTKKCNIDFGSQLNQLKNIATALHNYKKSCEINFDLTDLHGFDYQGSVIYTAYVPDLRKEIALGGRYRAYQLSKTTYREATGFSLDLRDLLSVFMKNGN
ncbi:MAG: hypothetical protein CMD65_03230 [Gammaproteobacteria bacterium]|nr:hypothetical protein [Gammaproteobacteria bacterium]